MKHFKYTYQFLIILLLLISCKSTKFVPKDRYLLKKNKIEIRGEVINEEDLAAIIRQQPNIKMIGLKWDLFVYNRIDSVTVVNKRKRISISNHFENLQLISRQDRINQRRIERAKKKGKTDYKEKRIELKDTLHPRLFFREWLKYKVGEPPVIFDSTLFLKSIEQINAYLKKKGFYYHSVEGKVHYKKNRKAIVNFTIETGKRYTIDSVYVESDNVVVKEVYNKFIQKAEHSLVGRHFDSDYLDNYRVSVAGFMRDEAIYGFSPNNINFIIDTNQRDMKVILGINFKERKVYDENNKDSLITRKYQKMYVENVYFHIADSSLFKGNFKDTVLKMGLVLTGKYLPTIDTLFYNQLRNRKTDEILQNRTAYFLYNGELFLDPKLIEVQSFLEKEGEVTETFIETTYTRLQQLGLFQTIKTEIVELPESNKVQVHYYLIPSKKEAFNSQFRVTNTNGYFGLSTGINYSNKNLFKGAEKLTFGLNASLITVPPVGDVKSNDGNIKGVVTKFYQFEIGPSIKLELPGLFLIQRSKVNKSRYANTIFFGSISFQKRDIYLMKNLQLSATWKYNIRNTQTIQMGIPGISAIKYVNIQKSGSFEDFLKTKNSPFLTNTFSNQFIWQDWKVSYEYRDKDKASKKRNSSFYYLGTFDVAGNTLSAFRNYQKIDTSGQYRINGLIYTQFARVDNTVIFTQPITKTRSLNFRGLAGIGVSYGNSKTSMPFSYSFYSGGSNDVRGWKWYSLGPGSYNHYTDINGTSIQVGDIRLAASSEFRYEFTSKWKGAFFVDGGNIWTLKEDKSRPGSQFSKSWFKEIAISPGLGIRRDFDYFIVRVDLGFPIHNPALPLGERWIFQKHSKFNDDLIKYNITSKPTPFKPFLSFGIGYPF